MREIKFRAWNKEFKKIENDIPVLTLKFYADTVNNSINNLEIMQYTGLKDKNGVEIYEGDYMLDGHSGGWAEVKFIKGAFVIDFDNEIQDLYDWTCECVIGNIYENKELLK